MSKYDNHNTSHLPLIESVIIIAIFAVVSVLIMQLYVAADRIQGKSVNVSKATILAENTVEKIKNREITLSQLPDSDEPDGDGATLFFDRDWNEVYPGAKDSGKSGIYDGVSFYLTYGLNSVEKDASGRYVTFTVTVGDIGVLTGGKGEQLASIEAGMYDEFTK